MVDERDEDIDPATVFALCLLDAGFEIEDIDWQSISDMRRYVEESDTD